MLEVIKTPFGEYAVAPNFREQMRIDPTKPIHFHQEVMGTFEPAKKPTTEEMRDLAEHLIELQKKKLLEEMRYRTKISEKPAPTLPEICRANIDAGHNTEGDWAAYIDACLDRQMETGIRTPVLITGFECKDGRGPDVLRAGGEIGLWRQEPFHFEGANGMVFEWHIANYSGVAGPWTIPQEIYWMLAGSLSGVQGRYSCVETAKFDLLAAMVRYARANV